VELSRGRTREVRIRVKYALQLSSHLDCRGWKRAIAIDGAVSYVLLNMRIKYTVFSPCDQEPCPYPLIGVINRKNRLLPFHYSRHEEPAAGLVSKRTRRCPDYNRAVISETSHTDANRHNILDMSALFAYTRIRFSFAAFARYEVCSRAR